MTPLEQLYQDTGFRSIALWEQTTTARTIRFRIIVPTVPTDAGRCDVCGGNCGGSHALKF